MLSTIFKSQRLFLLKFHLHFKEKISNLIEENSFWTNRGTLSTNREWEIVWKQHKFLPIAFHIRDTIRRLENNKIRGIKYLGNVEGLLKYLYLMDIELIVVQSSLEFGDMA